MAGPPSRSKKVLTPERTTVLLLGMSLRILQLAVHGVYHSPACWPLSEFKKQGYEEPKHHICPDHAEFEVWIESPETGWYEMCQNLGWGYLGYDGTSKAFAVELEECWLSWDDGPHSLSERLRKSINEEE